MNVFLLLRVHARTCAQYVSALLALTLGASKVAAATLTWATVGSGNWVDGINWVGGVPPTSATADVGLINNGGTALINPGDIISTGSITLGSSAATDFGNIMMTGGTVTTTNSDIRIGGNSLTTAGVGRFDQTDGTITMNAGNLNIGQGSAGAIGTYNLSGGSITVASNIIAAIGNRGTGTMNQSGGTFYVRGTTTNAATSLIQIGRNAAGGPGSGTFTLSGGTAASSLFNFGQAVGVATSTNTFNLQGTGTLLTGTISFLNTAATNNFNFVGGSLTATTMNVPLTNNGGTLRPQTLSFTGAGDITNIVSNVVGTMTFSGTNSYIQTPTGTLAIDIAAVGVNDLIDIGIGAPIGTATLGGTISLSLLGGFDPAINTTFDILTADTITNTATVIGSTPSGRTFGSTIATGGDGRQVLRLVVIPEPSSSALLALAASAFGLGRRRR